MGQQQCDWTRQCLYDPTGPGPVGPAQCKMPVDHPTVPWVSKMCLDHVGQFCRVRFWICLVVPARKIKSLFSWTSCFTQTQENKGISSHSLTSVPGAVCGCLASSPRRLDTSTVWSGRLWWELRGRRKPALSRLNALPLVESSLYWCSLQNWKRRNNYETENRSTWHCRTLALMHTSSTVH